MSDGQKVLLEALDASNPLAFLASIGILRTLYHRAEERGEEAPSLSFVWQSGFRPMVHGVESVEVLIEALLEDRDTWNNDEALQFAYDASGDWLPLAQRGDDPKLTRDLKPPPEQMRTFLESIARRLESAEAEPLLRRTLDTAAAYGSEIVQDNNGNTKPTSLHFTAGSQRFLDAIVKLHEGVNAADFDEALRGPWKRQSTLPNMSWDSTYSRAYALRAVNPSDDPKLTIAAADWLAYIGLGALPVFPRGRQLLTTGVFGGWKDSVFIWPIWSVPLSYRVAVSALRTPILAEIARELREPDSPPEGPDAARARRRQSEHEARGIAAVFMSKILRSDQGGYGSFSPARMVG